MGALAMTAQYKSEPNFLHGISSDEEKKHKEFCPELTARAQGRDTLPTHEAATVINRAPQTLRKWACLEDGPIRPVRIHGRLHWRVSDLSALLSGEAKK